MALFKREKPKGLQSARIGHIAREQAAHPAIGLKPAQLVRLLIEAESGHLVRQAELFMDMEERDAHLFAELAKRKRAVSRLEFRITPPDDASRAETQAAKILTEALRDSAADLFLDLLDGIGHGFAACEIEWQQQDGYWIPAQFHHRPQTWFTLDEQDQSRLLLRKDSGQTEALQPFGWIVHKPKARSGTLVRAGLFRVLAMPYLLKHYALQNMGEFLEIYGLPIRIGKYPAGIAEDDQDKLLQIVTNLGHSAAGIIPESQLIEFQQAASGSEAPFLAMQRLCDEAMSKAILGGTLTSSTSESGGGAHALGQVHNEVRRDLMEADAWQLAQTLNRELITPFCAVNFVDVRPPRLQFELEQTADISAMAAALPQLARAGLAIPKDWVHQTLGIPQAESGQETLQATEAAPVTALSAQRKPIKTDAKGERYQALIDRALPDEQALTAAAGAINAPLINLLMSAQSEKEALTLLARALPNLPTDTLTDELTRLMLAAEIAGVASMEG